MNILHVIEMLDTGGAQRLLTDALRVMSASAEVKSLTLVIYTSLPDSPFERQLRAIPGVKVVSLDADKREHLKVIKRLRSLMRQADVCHVHLFPALYHCAIASIGLKTRMVYTEHSTHNRRRNRGWLRPVEQIVYGRYDAVACISEAVMRNLTGWLRRDEADSKFSVVGNGLDLGRFAITAELTDEEMQRRRRELFGRDGRPVLMISRMVESKDHPTLLLAIAHLTSMKQTEDIFAALIGDGPRRQEIEGLAEELGLTDRVIMLGEKGNIEDYIAAAEVGVQSSNWEGFGLTVVEMMAGGLPVIVSDVSGMSSLVEGVGEKFERGNAEELAAKIAAYASMRQSTPERRRELIAAGRRRSEHFGICHTVKGWLLLYLPSLP